MPTLLWLQTGACSGDTLSLLNAESPNLVEVLDNYGIEVLFHPSLSLTTPQELEKIIERIEAGEQELTVLAVEGSLMLGPDGTGMFDSFRGRAKKDIVASLCEHAHVVVAMGTCAAFGGVPASGGNPTDAVGMQYLREEPEGGLLERSYRSKAGLPVINVSGCPAHPNTMVQTLIWALTGAKMELDHLNRPLEFFSTLVHQGCTRNEYHEFDVEEHQLGKAGCLYFNLGCEGPNTMATCNSILWNNQSSKTRAGVPCFACTSPSFPKPHPLFQTEKLGDVPVVMPLGVSRAAYMSYKGLAKAAAPVRLVERKTKF
jgi:NiFe hydrogenase small subunit HydA